MKTTVLLFARFRSFEGPVRCAFEQIVCLVVCMRTHKLRCKITKYLENSKEKGLIFSAAVEITQDYTGFYTGFTQDSHRSTKVFFCT